MIAPRSIGSGCVRLAAGALAFGLIVAAGGSAAAQGIDIGVRGGINLASATFDDPAGGTPLDSVVAPVAGAFVTVPLWSWLELQPEVLYSVKGSRLNLNFIETRLLVDYLEVPVLGRFSRRGGGPIDFYVIGGVAPAFRLRARARTRFSGAVEEIDLSDEVEALDLGVVAGGGVEIGHIVIDGRYTHGIRDTDADTTDDVKVTNRTWSFTAGFRF